MEGECGSGRSLEGFLGFLPPVAGRLGFPPDTHCQRTKTLDHSTMPIFTSITTLPLDTWKEGGRMEKECGSGISLFGFLLAIAGRLGFSPDMQGT